MDRHPADPTITPFAAIAVFFSVFGAGVISAVFWTEDAAGRVVNLACGLVFLGVGLVFARAQRNRRR